MTDVAVLVRILAAVLRPDRGRAQVAGFEPRGALSLSGPITWPVMEAATWLAALLAISIPVAVTRYRHATSS